MFTTSPRFTHLRRAIFLLLVVLVIGTYGLMALEGYGFIDALYMTIITISTVGYREVRTLDHDGHIFIIFLIVIGLAVMTYTLGASAQILIEGQFHKLLGEAQDAEGDRSPA